MRAEKVIKALLDAASGVAALVGTRMYAVTRPEGDSLPAIVWQQITDMPMPPINASAGAELARARMQVNCLGASPEDVKTVLEQVRLACHLKSGTLGGVTVVSVLQDVTGSDIYDSAVDTYSQSIDFSITYYR